MNIILKTKAQVEQIKHNGQILRDAVNKAQDLTKPGISTLELDQIVEDHIRENGALPTFKGYGKTKNRKGFPGSICISVNDVLVHGVPSKKHKIANGDIVSIDIGVTKGGCVADSCYSYIVGQGTKKDVELVEASKEITMFGISLVQPGIRIHDLARAIETKAKQLGYSTMPDLYGHGTGIQLHEKPTIPFVQPPYREVIPNIKLQKDMVITIEPVVAHQSNMGRYKEESDQWTLRTIDGTKSAQFEHTILVADTPQGHEILTGTFR